MERLIKYFVPEEYDLNLGLNKESKKIGGSVLIRGEARADVIKLDSVNLEITHVLLNGEKADYEVGNNLLTIKHAKEGKAEILVQYEGALNENMQGAYLSTYEHGGKTEKIIATQFESHYAREAFPCVDEPGAKAVFRVKLIVPDTGDTVLSNTPVKSTTKYTTIPDGYRGLFQAEDGKKIADKFIKYEFEATPRMSTYLLAWVVGPLQGKTITNKHGVKITTYTTLAQDINSVDYANEIAARSLEFYDDNFGVPYPLKKLDQVALPDFEAGAMENWGLVTYRETMMLVSKAATLGTKKSVALTVAHELSHQWFGDLVTMQWWDDLWLNESFASIMEYYAVDHIHPEYQIYEGFFTRDAYSALVRDAYTNVQSVHQDVSEPSEIATLFDSAIVYSKGAHLMLMLIRAMGWQAFCAGCRDYFEKYKYSNTVGDDLWASLDAHADFDVASLMHSFIDKPGYPVFTGTEQKRFLLDGEMKKSDWPVPSVTDDMSGHYIINLSDDEFNEKLSRFDELSLEQKLRLLIDKSLTTRTSLASADTIVPLVQKFTNENSAAVWNIVSALIGILKVFTEEDTPEDEMLKHFVKVLITPKLNEVGLTTRPGDDENILRLRAILLGLDFYAEDLPNLEKLASMYNRDYASLDPEIRDDILDAKIYTEPAMIDEYLDAYTHESDPEIKFDLLYAGTVVKDVKVLEKLMKLLEQPEIVKPQDQLYLFIYLYRNEKISKKVFQWMTEKWDYIVGMMGEKTMDSYPRYIANLMRTEDELTSYIDFFGPKKNDPVLTRAIEIGEKEIRARINLITTDRPAVLRALEKATGK
ncbi:M1 family metallopeptidase [Candidatus Saccharibacteria bacterium]|nr:M1 family metallopeptidase [Candidatus Saccharibacteria bacterium]